MKYQSPVDQVEVKRWFNFILRSHREPDRGHILYFNLIEMDGFAGTYPEAKYAKDFYYHLLDNPFHVTFWLDRDLGEEFSPYRRRLRHLYDKLYDINPRWRCVPFAKEYYLLRFHTLQSTVNKVNLSEMIGQCQGGERLQVCTNIDGALFLKMFASGTEIADYRYLSSRHMDGSSSGPDRERHPVRQDEAVASG